MAQMPPQFMSGRAEPYAAARPAAYAAPFRAAAARPSHVSDNGAISGGLLRPGAVDQELFKAHLAAAQRSEVTAPPAPGKAPVFSGIPTLSPAQLAALGVDLGGASGEPAEAELVIDIPASNPSDPHPRGPAHVGHAGEPAGGVGGRATPLSPPTPASGDAAPAASAEDAADSNPEEASAPDAPLAPAMQARATSGPMPGARRGADGAWELPRLPNKEERDMLRGQQWRVVESEAARKLFLGPDGAFGWDDFLDIINPLQHIPLVNIAYRAITGDEIYGAARMIDVAFGPLAGVSTAIDLAFRDVTGKSMASNAIAALFGPDEAEPGDVSVNTASGTRQQLVDAGLIRRGSNR